MNRAKSTGLPPYPGTGGQPLMTARHRKCDNRSKSRRQTGMRRRESGIGRPQTSPDVAKRRLMRRLIGDFVAECPAKRAFSVR